MINIFKLNKKRDQNQLNKRNYFQKVLRKIHNKIERTSDKGFSQAIYIIPRVVLGLPVYDQLHCASYCVNRLRANGFLVIYTYPNMLFVSWGHVPSTLENPQYKPIAYEILTKPEKDYSAIIQRISNNKTEIKKIQY